MEHKDDECVKKKWHTEMNIKIEVQETVPCAARVDSKIDVNHLKQESGLVQSVKSKPVLLVKEEILEARIQGTDERQGVPATSTCANVGRTSVATDSVKKVQMLHIKEELEDTDLDIGSTVFQNMETNQTNLNGIKQEITILNLNSATFLSKVDYSQVELSQVKNESIGSSGNDNAALAQCSSITPIKGEVPSRIYRCKICKQNFECQRYLSRHTKQVHKSEVAKHQSYRCSKCLKVCKSKHYLWHHRNQVHGTGSHTCTQCNKKFKCKPYLQKHVRNTHSEAQYKCDICKKMYKSRAALHSHVSSFHRRRFADPEDGNYRCNKCMKTFLCERGFKRHCKDIHGSELYKCTKCNNEYKCKRYLWIHLNNVHSKQKFECDNCKKIFKSRKMICRHILKIHIRRLPGSDDNYTCDHCQQTFRKKLIMQQHIEVIHGERIHRCRKCNKTFKCRSHLQLHKTVIHGKLQHECEVCHRFFTTRNILNAHVKKYHGLGDTQVKSDLCSQEVYISYSIAGDTGAVAGTGTQQCSAGDVKPEVADAELELGPVVFQHMDANYRPHKEEPQLD